MKDDPRFHNLNNREKMVFDYIKKHPGQNKLQITEGVNTSKNTVAKNLKQLCNSKLIEFAELKQGEKSYFHRLRGTKTFVETHKQSDNDFEYRRSQIRKCIKSLENVTHQEGVHAYTICIKLILSFDNVLKFTLSVNRQKKLIKHWLELQKENQEILDEITAGISGTLYGRVLLDLQKTEGHIADELELFMKKIKKL